MAGVKFLLKKERVFFSRGSALQVFGQCGGAKCGARAAREEMVRGRNPAPSSLSKSFVLDYKIAKIRKL